MDRRNHTHTVNGIVWQGKKWTKWNQKNKRERINCLNVPTEKKCMSILKRKSNSFIIETKEKFTMASNFLCTSLNTMEIDLQTVVSQQQTFKIFNNIEIWSMAQCKINHYLSHWWPKEKYKKKKNTKPKKKWNQKKGFSYFQQQEI